jgi:flagellar biosynthesis GTPase FlhF
MSITTPSSSNGHHKTNGVRVYRGRSLVDVIPQIRADLGPDAVILREREGLVGGVSGFFAKRVVEVEAQGGASRIDLYDDEHDDEQPDPEPDTEAEPVAESKPVRKPAAKPASRSKATPRTTAPTPTPTPTPTSDVGSEPPSFAAELAEAQIDAESEPAIEPELTAATDVPPVADPEPEAATTPVPDEPVFEPVPARRAAQSNRVQRRSVRALSARQRPQRSEQDDRSAGAEIAHELTARGVSQAEAQRLILEAAAHGNPFAPEGGLREAVRRTLAHGIPRATTLPSGGAAVAFVGAGGAGKTRCTAALATAYSHSSTLSVTVLSLGSAEGKRTLAQLLKRDRVPVSSAPRGGAARQIASDRCNGLVIVDTAAAAPSDQAAVAELSAELESLALDAVYVAVPATLGAQAARQLLAGLQALAPTGIVVTHADETDQLGVAAELAWTSGTPIAFIHEGLELSSALSAPDPLALAKRLLP